MVDHRLTETSGLTQASAATPEVLPNFCSTETLVRVFVVLALLALVVVLLQGADDPLTALAPILMFAFWVAFSSLLLLCLLQRWLRRVPLLWQVVIPTLLPVVNTALVHLGAERYFFAAANDRLRVIAIAALLSLIAMRYFYLIAAWQHETRLVARAREQALRARVRPHFLFNSMNSIAGLCRSDPARAEQVTLDLADLFRATFATGVTQSLAEELELVRAYLDIEQTRFGERLALEWDLPPPEQLDVQVPALVLQPLVENAIQHGISPARDGGRVSVRATREGQKICIELSNTLAERSGNGTQTAGDEARARLHHCFGDRAQFEAQRRDNIYRVRLTLPATQNPPCDTP